MNLSEFLRVRGSLPSRAKQFLRFVACWTLAAQLAVLPLASAAGNASTSVSDKPTSKSVTDPVMKVMQTELARASTDLGKTDSAPYFMSYTVYDQNLDVLVGAYGSLLTDASLARRSADVTMRVGSPALDNTHGQSRFSGMTSGTLPLGNDQDAIARVLWELTDREYKRAAPAFLNVRTNNAVRAEEEDKSPDFSKETPETHLENPGTPPPFNHTAWS
ncbi:MAG: hypothetical protein WA853_15710, partial [Candidatus Acidiferrum sp.]